MEVREELREVLSLFDESDKRIVALDVSESIIVLGNTEENNGEYRKLLESLITRCNVIGASILRINFEEGTGLVELSNGTPSSVWFEEGKWY